MVPIVPIHYGYIRAANHSVFPGIFLFFNPNYVFFLTKYGKIKAGSDKIDVNNVIPDAESEQTFS